MTSIRNIPSWHMMRDTMKLYVLAKVEQHERRLEEAHDATQRRLALHRQVRECAETIYMTWRPGGTSNRIGAYMPMVAIVHGGRDCDGVETSGNVTLVPADWRAVMDWETEANRGADGPIWWSIAKPSDAARVKPTWRDRTLEAFENGHPWSI